MAYRRGVKFLKINKTDALGNDKTAILSQLKNIRIKYSDIGVVQYDVFGKTEYPTYFLYQVNYKDSISPVDRGVNDYTLDAGALEVLDASSLLDDYVLVRDYNGTSLPNPTHFDEGSGIYTITTGEHYPNAILVYTASVAYDQVTGFPIYPKLIFATGDSAPGTIVQELTPGAVGDPGTITISGSFPIVDPSNINYFLVVSASSQNMGSGVCRAVHFSAPSFKVSQSIAPTGNNMVVVVPSPDTALKFEGTDCDVTYGFIDRYTTSQYFMDVDYSTGLTVPTNQVALISGTATPATVKDYYYNLRAQTLPRYVGSRLTGQQLNTYTAGDISFGKDPVVNLGQAYFSYFNYIYGVSPEVNGVIAADIKYVIDQAGDIYAPGLDSEAVRTLRQNYPEGSVASVKLIGETNQAMSTYLNKEFTVYRAGAKVKPILYSQTGSLGYTSSIVFNPTAGAPKSYKLAAGQTDGAVYTIAANSQQFPYVFSEETVDEAGYYNNSTGVYTFTLAPLVQVKFQADVSVTNTSATSNSTVQLLIVKNNTIPLANVLKTLLPGENNASVTATGGYASFAAGDTVSVKLINLSTTNTITSINGYFQTFQNGLAGSAATSAPFFLSGSSPTSSVLTCSLDLFKKLGYPQADITSSGFNPIVDNFTFKVGDQLRFQNDETRAHTITAIGNSSTLYGPTLTITPPLVSGSNIDFFLLRRFEDSINTVLLVGGKPSGGTSGGTLIPKYVSDTLQKGTSTILANLSSKNLI